MIKNYLKAALAAMWRRKWFSLLTLFSIAISLVVVTCGASIWNMITAPIAPEVHKDRTFFLDIKVWSKKDGTLLNLWDAPECLPKGFLSRDVYQFKTPELTTVYEKGGGYSEFIRNNKIKRISLMQTDANFFKVFEFEFVAGKPYKLETSEETIPRCVISEELAYYYFGAKDCLGQIITDKNLQYKVAGVIKKPATLTSVKSDLYYQINPQGIIRNLYAFNVGFLCHSSKDKQVLDAELKHKVYSSDKEQVTLSSNSSVKQFFADYHILNWEYLPIYMVFIMILLVLPSLCLIDILKNNQSDRNEELAIRRAFGAPRTNIMILLLVDNLFVTIVGGVLGLVFSFLFFAVLNEDSWSNLFFVFFNWRAFFYYIAVFMAIGVIAGILPAYRLSKQQIVSALNAIEND